MFELHRRGHARVATTANCGHPAGQYDVALVDWRRRTFRSLSRSTLDWLLEFLEPRRCAGRFGSTRKMPAANVRPFDSALEGRGFVIEAGTVHDCGCAVSARRREMNPVRKAA